MIAWDEMWPMLRHGDVHPLPLATETNWMAEGWEVNLILLRSAGERGHSAWPVWSYREPYANRDAGASEEEASAVHERAMAALAERLRTVLEDQSRSG